MTSNSNGQDLGVYQLRRFDAICDRFERAWRAGDQPQIDDFLRHESASDRLELARQLLDVEIECRRAAQLKLPLDEYQKQFPQLSAWLARRLVDPPDADAGQQAESAGTANEDPFLGLKLGTYELLERLGCGGMGVVYRARHTMIDCQRAVKLLHPEISRDPHAVKRFLLEAQACVSLNHPHIVTTYHVDQHTDGTLYIVMELVQGRSLDQLVTQHGPLGIEQAALAVEQVAQGLESAHRRGIVHRDIKPQNIMWTDAGTAKILDLGLVRLLESDPHSESSPETEAAGSPSFDALLSIFQSRLTHPHALLGTLPYMSPEQAADAGGADERSDVYSLGCTFYFLLTGVHPFAAESVREIVVKHLRGDTVAVSKLRAEVPQRIQQILAKMMHRQREQRYAAAALVAQDLAQWRAAADAGAVRSAVDLEDLAALRESLIQLQVVSAQQWEQAAATVERIQRNELPNRLSTTTVLGQNLHASKPTLLLQQLQRAQAYGTHTDGLSEFQTRHIIAGNADLLRLPRHVLIDQLGHGWKGEVFLARRLEQGRLEAMRTFAPGQLEGLAGIGNQRLPAFSEAVEKLTQLQHPAIPPVLDTGSYQHRLHGELAYLTTEFRSGETLFEIARRGHQSNGRLAARETCIRWLRDLCDVLQYVHDQGCLHLDLHPRSILVSADGRLSLLDVGVASLLHPPQQPQARPIMARTRSLAEHAVCGEIERAHALFQPPPIGTAQIMPPEQWRSRGAASPAVDIYNLGCTLYFVLAGEFPFGGPGALDLMQQHLSADPLHGERAQRIPHRYRGVLRQALAKSPADRFASAAELSAAIDKSMAASTAHGSWLADHLFTMIRRWRQPG